MIRMTRWRFVGVCAGILATAAFALTLPHAARTQSSAPVFVHYSLQWDDARWHSVLGPNYPYSSDPLPLPGTVGSSGCSAATDFSGDQLLDIPSAGLYNQDLASTIDSQIRVAASHGVTGFLVKWQGTGSPGQTPQSSEPNNRLDLLVQRVDAFVAAGQSFSLGVDLANFGDYTRPAGSITADLDYVSAQYGGDVAFNNPFDAAPLVMFLGSRNYGLSTLQAVSAAERSKLFLIGDETSDSWDQDGKYLDGTSYYWSTENPANSSAAGAVSDLANKVHAAGKQWFAPLIAGYNRQLGSGSCVPNNGVQTLDQVWNINAGSSPDGWFPISWNSYVDSTYFEPSARYGSTFLDELSRLIGAGPGPTPSPSPTSTPSPTPSPTASSTPTPTPSPTDTPTPTATPTPSPGGNAHVMVVVLENREYSAVVGASTMPYLNGLLQQYGAAKGWYGVAHPSLPNYLALISGSTQGVTDDGTGYTFSGDNLGHQLSVAGIPWKAYMESMPSACYTGGSSGDYAKKHDPFMYFSDITSSSKCASEVVPGTQFTTDLTGNKLPDFIWYTPNLCNDGHDCSNAHTDTWLATFLPSVLTSQWYQQNGVVIVTYDEGSTDLNGGGHIATVVVSGAGCSCQQTSTGNHYGTLRTIEDLYGLPNLNKANGATTLNPLLHPSSLLASTLQAQPVGARLSVSRIPVVTGGGIAGALVILGYFISVSARRRSRRETALAYRGRLQEVCRTIDSRRY